MLCRSYIAEEGSACCRCNRASDRCCNMIISGRNISYQRSQYIEGRALADSLLNLHIGSNLIQRHMSRPLNHNLYILFPGPSCQLSQRNQLLHLGNIGGILQTSRTACISQTQGYVILSADIENSLIVLVERILLSRHFHPCKNDRTAGNNVGQTLCILKTLCRIPVDSHMDGHKIHTVLSMHFHNLNPFLGGNFFQRLMIINHCIINRNGSNHGRTLCCQLSAELLRITEGAEIHNGFCPHIHRIPYLFQLHINVLPVSGGAEIYVDFCFQHGTDSIGNNACMQLIAGNNRLSLCNQSSQLLWRHLLCFRCCFHFFCNNSLSCSVHLCCVFSHRFPPFYAS